MVEGYPYSLVMTVTNDEKNVKIVYRVKNFDADIDLGEVLNPIGFDLKGHPKAGGGLANNMSLHEAEEKYLQAMRNAFRVFEIE